MATNDTQFSEGKTDRSMRLLQMFDRLQRGSGISTKALQQEFGITAKSVQRDIGELRVYIAEAYTPSVYGNIEYNRIRKEYYWRNRSDMLLHEKEILLLVTILLESRGLTKEELNRLVDKMLVQCSPESEKHIRSLLKNELFLYKQTENAHTVKDLLWQLSEAKQQQRYVLLAEVYTRGAKMWFLSQAEFLEVMEPADFRQEMQETISRMLGNYQEQVQLP